MGKHYLKCLACGRVETVYSGVKYFRLPKNLERRKKWLSAIDQLHLLDEQLPQDFRVCEKHFSKDMYSKVRLKFSCTPTLNILRTLTDNSKETTEVQQNEPEPFIPVVHNENTQLKEFLMDDYGFKGTHSFNDSMGNINANEYQSDMLSEAEATYTERQQTQINFMETAKTKDNILNTANKTVVQGGIKMKPTVIPHRFNCEQLPEYKIIKNPTRPFGEKTYLKKKLVNVLPNSVAIVPVKTNNVLERPKSCNNKMTSELSKSSISIADQMPIESEHKEIECLEAVVKYTSQMQSIVKQKGGLDSFIQANTHLIKLLDKVVYEWFQRAQRRIEIGVITDNLFIQKALESKQIFCIQNFDPDHDWLNKFKTKYNITDLDMRLLHIQNNIFPPSVDIYEIVLHVLKQNPITEYFSNTTPNHNTILENENNIEMQTENEMIPKTVNARPDEDTDMEVPIAISNDEQARLHLKPLEEYVLLKDNFRALGLISQLIDIFSAEIKK